LTPDQTPDLRILGEFVKVIETTPR
jgi:hypothetical protein